MQGPAGKNGENGKRGNPGAQVSANTIYAISFLRQRLILFSKGNVHFCFSSHDAIVLNDLDLEENVVELHDQKDLKVK